MDALNRSREAGIIEKSRRFYENHVADLIRDKFREYESRIAVGIAGEGSDCFGYDDLISRDHDFGTGVCLWVPDEDMAKYGYMLSIAYNELADRFEDEYITDRIRQRRGVQKIHDFYSNILNIDCDTDGCTLSERQWRNLDHTCLATATNGEVFRDDLGKFSAFRRMLLSYYPDRVWRTRIAEELHAFASSMQVNYARCMTRGDVVAAGICRSRGVESAMELFFLAERVYPPYYKWKYRALSELEKDGEFAGLVRELSQAPMRFETWKNIKYNPNRLNTADEAVVAAEKIARHIVVKLNKINMIHGEDPYLERYVDVVLM